MKTIDGQCACANCQNCYFEIEPKDNEFRESRPSPENEYIAICKFDIIDESKLPFRVQSNTLTVGDVFFDDFKCSSFIRDCPTFIQTWMEKLDG